MSSSPQYVFGRVRNRGSVLIITIIFAAGVALSLGSFLALSLNAAKLSGQSFHSNSALNLAEAGLEQALNAMNHDSYSGWAVHATGPNSFFKATSNLDLGQGATGEIKVLIYDTTSKARKVVAEGIVRPANGAPVRKQIEMIGTRRSVFATGLVAKDAMNFSGNGVVVDSWNSDPDDDPSTAPIPYSSTVARDNGNVASTAVTISIGNADVWGFVRTGRDAPNVGPNGTIAPFGSPIGTKDPTRIRNDFTYDFRTPDSPTGKTLNVITGTIGSGEPLPLSLPEAGDVATYDPEDGLYKYYYQLPGIDASGNASKVLTITDNVVLLPTAGSGATAIGISGNASIRIESDALLEIYTAGNMAIAGNGFVNCAPTASTTETKLATANQPKQLKIVGTNTSVVGQDFSISGNGVLSAIVNAPNARVSLNGGGSSGHVLGSFVGRTVTVTGGNSFHYDESLKQKGDNNPFEIGSWRELFGSYRVTF